MKVVKHLNRWMVETDNGYQGRFKTQREAKALLVALNEEASITPEQREIKALKQELEEAQKLVQTHEVKIEELENEVESLEERVSELEGERNISDDEEEAIYLVDQLKLAQERLSLGVISEAETIRDINEKLIELKAI